MRRSTVQVGFGSNKQAFLPRRRGWCRGRFRKAPQPTNEPTTDKSTHQLHDVVVHHGLLLVSHRGLDLPPNHLILQLERVQALGELGAVGLERVGRAPGGQQVLLTALDLRQSRHGKYSEVSVRYDTSWHAGWGYHSLTSKCARTRVAKLGSPIVSKGPYPAIVRHPAALGASFE